MADDRNTKRNICVALIARSTLYHIPGGDTIQIQQTAQQLNSSGITAEIQLTDAVIDYGKYDLLHFFNITRPADILRHVQQSGKRFVLSTIYVDYAGYDKKHRKGIAGLLFRFLSSDQVEYLKTIMRRLAGKDRLISRSFLWKGQRRSIRNILKQASMLLPNSRSEYTRLLNRYQLPSQYQVVPNGVDTSLFCFDASVVKDPALVICVARIEGIKNQLNLIKALNNTKYRLLLIGAPAPNQRSYYNHCRAIAGSNVRFIDHLPQQELLTYYRQAAIHILPSWFETTGLSSLEAAAMGCKIIITDKGDTKEYFEDLAVYCDPSSAESIFAAVEKAASQPDNDALRRKISANYTWKQATTATILAYNYIL